MGVVICNNCKSFYWETTKRCNECFGTTFSPTSESNKDRIRWTCTDPDNKQYGRQVGDGVFEFKEPHSDGELTEMIIDLNKYSEEQQEKYVSAYYANIQEVVDEYGDLADWIIAECIFEQESGMY